MSMLFSPYLSPIPYSLHMLFSPRNVLSKRIVTIHLWSLSTWKGDLVWTEMSYKISTLKIQYRRILSQFIGLESVSGGMFNFKGSNMFFCVLFLKDSLLLISSWKTGVSRATCSSQDWDHEKGYLLGFHSVTPFSDLLLKSNLFSYDPLTQDMECFLALWRLLFAWLFFFLLNFFYCFVWRYINTCFCK